MAKRRKRNKYLSSWVGKLPVLLSVIIITVAVVVFLISIKNAAFNTKRTAAEVDNTVVHTEFINQLVPVTKELQQTYGILPSIIIGQAILESDWGQSELGATYHNLFGIKSYSDTDKSVELETKEYENGEWVDIKAKFKVFDNWDECMREHTILFVNGVDWDPYLYQGVLLADDYKTAARGLQNAGYATDPNYAQKIVDVIEANKLYQYD